jgi:uncharacterized membrane protein (UPF0127 family)
MLTARNQTRGTVLGTRIERADSSATRTRGLLDRSGLEPGEGLWIAPCEWVHMFGMKFAIDVVVLDRANKVVGVKPGLRPGRVGPLYWGAHSTLELPVGAIAASQTEKGDVILWEEPDGEDARREP